MNNENTTLVTSQVLQGATLSHTRSGSGSSVRACVMLTATFAAAAIMASFACRSGGGGAAGMCDSCSVGEDVYGCDTGIATSSTVCAIDEVDAEEQCQLAHSSPTDGLKTTCDDQGSEGETGSGAWNPGTFVYYDTSRAAYIVDAGFLDDLLAQPDQLLFDDAQAQLQSDNSFKLQSVATTDFAYKLGLRNNDKLVSLNGYSLADFDDMFETYRTLEASRPSTLRLKFVRSGVLTTNKYIIE